jgi:hypothetical protein
MCSRTLTIILPTLILSLASTAVHAAGPDAPASQPSIDAKRVASLVDELASDDFAAREAATQKLQEMGPEVIAALEPFKQSDNAEIRQRVIGIVRAFDWMKRGAIVAEVWPYGLGAKLGFRVGDAILKVDDRPIAHHQDVEPARDGKGPESFVVWRDNKIIRMIVPNERLHIVTVDWSIEHGGIEQARGYREMHAAKPNFDAAYKDLLAAKNGGATDIWTAFFLATLAARAMQPELAAASYDLSRPHPDEFCMCSRTHNHVLPPMSSLPFDGPHMQWLMKQYHGQPYSGELAHEIEDWCAVHGRNAPLLKELLAKTTPQWWQTQDPPYPFYHYMAAMRLAFSERRDEEVLANPLRKQDVSEYDVGDERAVLSLQAAVRLGRTEEATRIVMSHASEKQPGNHLREFNLWAFTAACAADDRKSIDRFLKLFKQKTPKDLDALFRTPAGASLQHPAAAAVLRKWWEETKSTNHATPIANIALASMLADPATTLAQFQAAGPANPAKQRNQNQGLYVATGLVRFGKYREATTLIEAGGTELYGREATRVIKDAADFAEKHKTELAGPWKELSGFIQVVRSGDNTLWVMRYDGAVFRIGPDGTLAAMPRLPIAPSPLVVGFAHLVPRAQGVFVLLPYPRKDLATTDSRVSAITFCSDASQKQWTPLSAWDGKYDFKPTNPLNRAIVLARADRDHPLPGPQPRMIMESASPMLVCEGDVVYARHPKTQALTDLCTEIAKLAGRKEPAHVYGPGPPDGTQRLIFSDCGLWTLNMDTLELRRVKLGLPDENVMTVALEADKYTAQKAGYSMVGVAPQQGGQMFLVSAKTGECEAVPGFCGIGPKDSYAYEQSRRFADDPLPLIHARYLERLAKAPAEGRP